MKDKYLADLMSGKISKDEYIELKVNEEQEIKNKKEMYGIDVSERLTGDIELTCKEYLSDSPTFMEIMKVEFSKSRSNKNDEPYYLVEANTGTGKTFSIYNIAKQTNSKFILIVPNVIVAESMANEYEGAVACNAANPLIKVIEQLTHVKYIFSTVDQLRALYQSERIERTKEFILIIDEAHYYYSSSNFRYKAISALEFMLNENVFKNVIWMTATDKVLKINRSKKDYKFTSIVVKRIKNGIKYNLKRIKYNCSDEEKFDFAVEYINKLSETGKVLVYQNRSKMKQKAMNEVYGWSYVNADTKDEEIYKSIIYDGMIPKDVNVLVCTDILTAGTNIYNDDFKHVVMMDERNPDTVKQFPARLRKVKELNVHVIDRFEVGGVDNYYYAKILGKDLVKQRNKLIKVKKNQYSFHRNGLINGIFIDPGERGEIVASKFAISNKLYNNLISQYPSISFDYYLREGIDSNDIIDVDFETELDFLRAKEKLKELRNEDRIEEVETYEEFREIMLFDLESLVISDVKFDEFCHSKNIAGRKKKALERMKKLYKSGIFNLNTDYEYIFRMSYKKVYEDQLRTRTVSDIINPNSGVLGDKAIGEALNCKQGDSYSKVTYARKFNSTEYEFKNFCKFTKHLFEATIEKGVIHIGERRPNIIDEFGELVKKKLDLYFIGAINKDEEYIKNNFAKKMSEIQTLELLSNQENVLIKEEF